MHPLPSPSSRATTCRIAPCGLLAIILVLISGCSLLTPTFHSPVAPLPVPLPQNAHALAVRLGALGPAPATLNVKLRVTARGGDLKGRQKLTILGLYGGPQRLKVKIEGSVFMGGLLQITQQNAEVAVHLQKDGRFYRGPLAVLESRPDVLFGFQPSDVVRALLVQSEVVSALQSLPTDATAPDDENSPDHWQVAEPLTDARREVYRIRKRDGLVDEIAAFDPAGRPKLRARYFRYDYFEGALYPSRFEMTFPETGLRLEAEVERVRTNPPMRDNAFSLAPPAGLDARPLREWLDEIPRSPVRINPKKD